MNLPYLFTQPARWLRLGLSRYWWRYYVANVTCILPAEYNIDPTGIGEKLGLTAIAQASEESPTLVINRGQQTDVFRSDSVEIVIPAGKGLEYKLYME